MLESERLERMNNCRFDELYSDHKICDRLCALLQVDVHDITVIDGAYYDFSVLPEDELGNKIMFRDAYLIYAITNDGKYLSKWVDRWDLDSDSPIIDGKAIHPPYEPNSCNVAPQIKFPFSKDLLSTPCPSISKMFGKE